MGLNNPSAGYHASTEFVSSGLPWLITGSTTNTDVIRYTFPKVTKSITIHNLETSSNKFLRLGFTQNGVNGVGGNYYFIIDSGDIVTLDARVTELFVRADVSNTLPFSIYAALTTIDNNFMPVLTGSIGGVSFWEGVG